MKNLKAINKLTITAALLGVKRATAMHEMNTQSKGLALNQVTLEEVDDKMFIRSTDGINRASCAIFKGDSLLETHIIFRLNGLSVNVTLAEMVTLGSHLERAVVADDPEKDSEFTKAVKVQFDKLGKFYERETLTEIAEYVKTNVLADD